jgi:hypothetical protein
MADKLAWFHFYPGDWMKDPNLRRCSPAARGVLMDILCLMFECEERGVLATAGIPWSDDDLAGALSNDRFASLECIKELETKCVLKRREDGSLVSNRLIRDENLRRVRAESGRKGGKRSRKQNVSKRTANTQADSDSDSDSKSGSGGGKGCKGKGGIPPGFARFWEARPRSPNGTNHPRWTDRAGALAKWRTLGLEARADEVIRSLEAWKVSHEWTREGGAYLAGVEPWLFRGKYEACPLPASNTRPVSDRRREIDALFEKKESA